MVRLPRKIVVDDEAKRELRAAYDYIKRDSVQNAEKVRNKIIISIKELAKNPEQYPPDKYRINNDGSYRAFEIYKYRISYYVSDDQVLVIRIRHTKMNPLSY